MKALALVGLGLAYLGGPVAAREVDALPRYRPETTVSGKIGIWGDDGMKTVVGYWEKGFRGFHPHASFATALMGSGTGMAGIYTGVADLAFLGREIEPVETMAFAWVFRYPPAEVEIMNGSFDTPGKSHALAVLVHRENPIGRLTLAQLDAAFGCERRRGLDPIRTWGQLGLTGEWAGRPIHLYSYDVETGRGAFFRRVVLKGSRKWNWGNLSEFEGADADRRIVEALVRDRFGIGVANSRAATDRVKPVALAEDPAGPYFAASRVNLIRRKYPLARAIGAFFNRAPGRPVDPKVKEFLRYVLSREGQEDVKREGDYLPLSPEAVREQARRLD